MASPKMKWGAVIFGTLLVGGAAYFVWAYWLKDKINDPSKPTKKSSTGSTSSTFPLQVGSKGDEVKRLQNWLNTNLKMKGQPSITVDGDFGAGTATALNTVTGKTSMDQTYFNNAKI